MEEQKTVKTDEVINYGYYNSENQYCIILNSKRLKEIFKADKIYLEEPKEDLKEH